MKKSMLQIDGVRILSKNELQSISGASDGVYLGHGACYSDEECPIYSSCDCNGSCVSWTGEDDGYGACD